MEKVYIYSDELYPVYFYDVASSGIWRASAKVDRKTIQRWEDTWDSFEKMQRELEELY